MSTEQLLQFLFDSRNHAATNDRSVPPTRVRLLRHLRDEPHTVTELAAALSIARQTVYRSTPTLTEYGLVRDDEDRYVLTCAGSILLTAIKRFTPHQQSQVLPTLSRSNHWRTVIESLTSSHASPRTHAADGGATQESRPSRSTKHRYVTAFREEGYISKRADGYELTPEGVAFLDQYDQLVRTTDDILAARSFLRWLPADLEPFPTGAIGDSVLIQNSPQQPHRSLNAFLDLIDTDMTTLYGMSTIVSPPLANGYQTVFNRTVDVKLLFTDDVLAELHHDPEYYRFFERQGNGSFLDGLTAPNVDLRFTPDELPVNLAVRNETRVVLTPDPASGVDEQRRPAIVSDDPAIAEWATNYFEAAHAAGRPPETVLEEVLPRDTASSPHDRTENQP